jgi:CysZ protein
VSAERESNLFAYHPQAANPIYHFAHGFRFFFAGLPLLLKHPSLLGLSLLPIALTLLLLIVIAFGAAWLAGLLGTPLLGGFLLFGQALIFLLVLFLGLLLYVPLARVVLAPFSEALSRRTEMFARGTTAPGPSLGWGRAVWEGAKLVALQLGVTVVALALGLLVPVVGVPVATVIAIFFCGLDYLDVPLSVRGLPLGRKLAVMWQRKSLALGFGAAGYLLLLIPLINLLSLPVGVIGATLLIGRLDPLRVSRQETD